MARNGKKDHDQPKDAMDGILAGNDHQGAEQGQDGEKPEEDFSYCHGLVKRF
jgi:hypothetical protein